MLHIRSRLIEKRESLLYSGISGEVNREQPPDKPEYNSIHRKGIMIKTAGIILFMILTLICIGCEKLWHDPIEEQPVYFEYHYINHAWGYQERGWLIDKDGEVRYFEFPDNYRLPDSTGILSLEDLEYNLGQTDSIITSIEQAELEEYTGYISAAAEGEIGEQTHIAADAGSSTLSCYLYDEEQDAYRFVFLATSGDWEQFNLAPEAETLVDWLRQFGVFWLSD